MSALYEYTQLLRKNSVTLSLREKKIANLILGNFKSISEKSKHGGSRSKFIYNLINQNFNDAQWFMPTLSTLKYRKNVTPTFADLMINNQADSHLRTNQKSVN